MLASIDIGTNTIRCLVVSSGKDVLTPKYVDVKIIRLGENFMKEGVITEASILRLKDALNHYSKKIEEFGIKRDEVAVAGTSVLRDAPNAKDILEYIRKEFGFNVRIISGEKEALVTLAGIASCFGNLKEFYALDIGGGSTEYACFKSGRPLWKYSLNMGVVHLTEGVVKSDPVSSYDLSKMEEYIDNNLNSLKRRILKSGYKFEPLNLLGTAGTATTLAMVDLELGIYDRLKVHGYVLKKRNIGKIYKKFIGKKAFERLNITGVEKGREDLVLAGTAIMLKSMNFFGTDSLTVSECGLLEGLIGYNI
ncbi:MAG: hypothetical protein M1458_03945 [Deltaproteobacteria bacterium]|nr:hypothetical protein [Deltaproteobacteria bacterium]